MRYHLVAVDFLPPLAIQAALTRLACEFARGAPPPATARSPLSAYKKPGLERQAHSATSMNVIADVRSPHRGCNA